MSMPSAPPQFSADGAWFWDGASWVPASQAPSAVGPEVAVSLADAEAREILTRRPPPSAERAARRGVSSRAFVALGAVVALVGVGVFAATRMLADSETPDEAFERWFVAMVEGDGAAACDRMVIAEAGLTDKTCRKQVKTLGAAMEPFVADADDVLSVVDVAVVSQDSAVAVLSLSVEGAPIGSDFEMRLIDEQWKISDFD